MALESSILSPPRFISGSGSKSLCFLYYHKQKNFPTKVLVQNNRYPFRLVLNWIDTSDFGRFLGPRCEGVDLFANRACLRAVGKDSESSSGTNAILGLSFDFVRVMVKCGVVLAAMVCGVLVYGARRAFAVEGVVNASYGVVDKCMLMFRNAWPKTLWPWKVCELAEKEPENGVFSLLRNDVTRFLSTILIGTTVVNIRATALVTEAATAIFGEAGVCAATGVMTVLILLLTEITPKSVSVHNPTEVARFVVRPVAWLSLVLYPVGRVGTYLSMGMLKILGLKGRSEPYVTEEELKLMLRAAELSGAIEEEEQDMIENVLEIKDTHVREVMTPLVDVVAIDASATLIDFHDLWVTHQYSRYARTFLFNNFNFHYYYIFPRRFIHLILLVRLGRIN
ncbi:hypothetical protein RchiOBHm_Chr5g0043101 [Rosa chinensis]|uniref:CNNM transmembrane domain-containing protein n=1 Tax=Rosa chinensis TaxID=74649 RepID=A0A2P6QD83_ROSCH|nr:hypothetical protein RchiOBHm_Chr5g0043101 [Rosa chinensis]